MCTQGFFNTVFNRLIFFYNGKNISLITVLHIRNNCLSSDFKFICSVTFME